MVIIIILSLIIIGASNYMTILIDKKKCEREIMEAIFNIDTIRNKDINKELNNILYVSRTKRSNMSSMSKAEILNAWTALCYKLNETITPISNEVLGSIDISDKTMSLLEHKKYFEDAVLELLKDEEFNRDKFSEALYHLYYIIF